MLKALAVLRTIFLIFIIGYTVRAMPFFANVSRTFDEQYARCSDALSLLVRAAWIAVGWIAFETLVGWWLATRRTSGRAAGATGASSGEPPFAPPR